MIERLDAMASIGTRQPRAKKADTYSYVKVDTWVVVSQFVAAHE